MQNDKNEKWNFNSLLSQGTFVNIRYQLASSNLVLPFIYMAIGAPVIFAGLILPIAQISRLISQLVLAPLIGGRGLRKWYIAMSMLTTAVALAFVGLVAHSTKSEWLGILFLLVAAVLGISGSISGLAYKDLVGRVLPEKRQNALVFTQTALAGLVTVLIALGSHHFISHPNSLDAHLELIWVAIVVTGLAGLSIACVRETPAATAAREAREAEEASKGNGLFGTFQDQFSSAMKVVWFRRFLVARTLFLSVELATPFYAVHAATYHASHHGSLSIFVIASSLGLFGGGILWGRIGAKSTQAVMVLASLTACAAGATAIAIEMIPEARSQLLHGVVFFLISLAAEGTSNARTLYLVNHASDSERPYFLAVSSVVTGMTGTAFAFIFGTLAHLQNAIWPVWCLVALNVIAAVYCRRLFVASRPAPAYNRSVFLFRRDNGHPHRDRADVMHGDLVEAPGIAIDAVNGEPPGIVPGRQQEPARGIDFERAGDFLGRELPDRCQFATRRIHGEGGDAVMTAVRRIEKPAAWSHPDLGTFALARPPVGQGRNGLETRQRAFFRIERVGADAASLLVREIDDVLGRMETVVARPGPIRLRHPRRIVRRQLTGLRIEAELHNRIRRIFARNVRNEDEAVRRISLETMRADGSFQKHGGRIDGGAVVADPVHSHLLAEVVGGEQVAPGAVRRHVAGVFDGGNRPDLRQVAGCSVDAETGDEMRIPARDMEKPPIRVQGDGRRTAGQGNIIVPFERRSFPVHGKPRNPAFARHGDIDMIRHRPPPSSSPRCVI